MGRSAFRLQNGLDMGVGAATVSRREQLSHRVSSLRAAGLLAGLLSACGGSGGGGEGSSTPAPYTIGGSVSGLTASGLVLANGSATLAVSSGSSSFTFPTAVATGTSYDISVQTQPAGETCVPDNPDGTVGTANVSNIVVHCFNPGTGTGWIPYTDLVLSAGISRLFVLQASSIPNAAPETVASSPVTSGTVEYWASSNGTLNGTHWDYALTFWGTGSDGNQHLYSISLTDASSDAPVPTQISNLSPSSTQNVCANSKWVQENLTDPSSAFMILDSNVSASECGSATDTWQVVHLTDSVSTAPVLAPIKSTNLTPVYAPSGALSGLVVVNPSTNTASLYDATFSNPKMFASNVQAPASDYAYQIADYNLDSNGHYLGDTLFFSVLDSTGQASLWRISYSGSISKIYSTTGQLAGVVDGNNFYFTDNAFDANSGAVTGSSVYQVAATKSAPTPLLLTGGTISSGRGSSAIGSNNAVLVLVRSISDTQAELDYVNVGVPNQTPTPIGGNTSTPGLYTMSSPNTLEIDAFLAGKTPADYAGALLYVTVNAVYSIPAAAYLEDYSSQIMSPTGTLMTSSANSAFIDLGLPYLGLRHGHVLGVSDIPSGSTYLAGGALMDYAAGTITSTSIAANGSPFLLPGAFYNSGTVSDIVGGSSGAADYVGATVHVGPPGHNLNEFYGLAINLQSDAAQLLDSSGNTVEFIF